MMSAGWDGVREWPAIVVPENKLHIKQGDVLSMPRSVMQDVN
jgi:hypothetical protein